MSVASTPRARVRRLADQADAFHAPSAAAATVLLAGCLGALSPYVAVAAAATMAALVATPRLVRLSPAVQARRRVHHACRGSGCLAIGVFVTGLTAVALPLVPAAAVPAVVLGGLVAALAMYLLGVLLLPGAANTVSIRLRRGFDGLSLGVSLSFVGWLILPGGAMPPFALTAALLAVGGLSIITTTALRSAGHRRVSLLCGAGAAGAVLGLAALVVLLAYHVPGWELAVAAAPLAVGPELITAGARRAGPDGSAAPEPQPSAYPLLTAPAVVATLAAGYHLVTVGRFNRTAIVLGLAVVPTLVVCEVFAVLDIRRYARRLAAREAHFRALVSGADDLTLLVGADLRVRWQSPAAARRFGLSDADVLGRDVAELVHPEDAAEVTGVLTGVLAGRPPSGGRAPLVTARLRDGKGAWRDTESTVSDQRDVPEVAALVVHVRDVGQRRGPQRDGRPSASTAGGPSASTDRLTGLADRRELVRAVAAQRAVPGHSGALLVVDLHDMSSVNDLHGREVGDAVLVEAGRRLRAATGPRDVPARLGGDEFAVVTADSPVLAYALATRLLAVLAEPYQLSGAAVRMRVSVGLAELYGPDGVDDVLRRADLARRRAHQLGRDRVEWYDAYLEEQFVRRAEVERELTGAAARGEFDLVYQPVLGLHDRQPVGTEALLRWRSPRLGTVLPAELLPVAEDLAVSEELGQWVLHNACRQLAAWSAGGRRLWMSVNVSSRELTAADFVSRVAATLATHRVAPERLVVEVVEPRAETDMPTVVAQLAGLRALGVRTALDDFGAGQSSLARLRRLPVDFLKIDSRLTGVERGGRRDQGGPPLDVVVGLGRRLGVEVVAEGLESATQVDQARAAGCRLGQGFALSRPATAERVEAYLEEFPTPSP